MWKIEKLPLSATFGKATCSGKRQLFDLRPNVYLGHPNQEGRSRGDLFTSALVDQVPLLGGAGVGYP